MSKRSLAVLIAVVLLSSTALSGAEIKLTALTLQGGKTVQIGFAKTFRTPSRAAMQATLTFDNGQASVSLKYEKMEPAVLFAGDISAYVLWAVTPDGSTENLGEVVADKKSSSGTVQGYTGKKTFALMVTAEPFATVTRPTELVVFVSGENQGMNIANTPFTFKDFATDYKGALDSISSVQYNDKTPAAVKQAMKALEIAGKIGAAEVNPKALAQAQAAFAKAQASTRDKKAMADQARVAAQLACPGHQGYRQGQGGTSGRRGRGQAAGGEGGTRIAGDYGRRGVGAGSPRNSRRSRSSARPWPQKPGLWPSRRRSWPPSGTSCPPRRTPWPPNATPSRRNATSWPVC